jgi:hypothetical protein
MPPRWPSSATPASQAPRWGIATLKVSCDQASLPAPTAIASVHTAAINFVLVIIAPPASLPANIAAAGNYMSRYPWRLQATLLVGFALDRAIVVGK